ncbi:MULTISPECIES: type I secretion system permease/ATPase [Sphingobium]|uniref:Type I secretion system permease/ATPase n=1 Tax=Sphingobium tyrosinilyticum TaxID=2715436 RepID=A0ABV9F7R0_9SPHN|nr:type I secretion system permease/ATPase [Sphingobium sp. EP60837]ANI76565.1 Type I secretion system ATP-binding protein PrsD [Sphingobium sp. EP60837]
MMLDLGHPSDIMAQALSSCRRHFLSSLIFSALLNLLYIAPVLYMLQVYDRVVSEHGTTTLLFLTLILLISLAALSLLEFVRSRLLVRASVRLDRQLSGVLLDTTLMRRGPTADTMNKQVLREFDTLRQALTGPTILTIFDIPWSPIYVIICFIIHPAIAALAVAGGAVLLFITFRNERQTSQPLTRANEAASKAYVSQEQTLAGAEIIRALGMRQALVHRHLAERQTMLRLQTEASFAGGRHVALSKFIRLSLQSLALGLGAWLAVNNAISAGAIFAASFLVGRALAPIDQLLNTWRSFVKARGSYETLNDLLAAREADIALTQLPAPAGRIVAEHVTLLSANQEAAILADISFAVEPGEVIAIVGPSGAGKSTLLRMLSGASRPHRGTIRFDGADIRDWDTERLAPYVGYLPQDTSLFPGSIRDNIARFQNCLSNDESAIDAAVVEAARASGVHDMILRLSGGYNQMLGWGGRGLSAGQAQRVGLARALYGNPHIIFLDEPNAHLDAEGEVQLVATLADLKKKNASVIVVAHRMGILGVVDKIMVMRDGRIETFGPRDEVLGRLKAIRSNDQNPVKVAEA